MTQDLEENRWFEHEVRKAAEAIWGLPAGECQPEFYTGDARIRELDGMARLRDVSHLIMATVSRRLEKVKEDVKKLNAAEKLERVRGVAIQKWLITKHVLEAEQLKICRESNVTALTLVDFKNRFFDARAYIARRRNAAFGSARNPEDNSVTLPEDEYIELPLRVLSKESGPSPQPTTFGIQELCDRISSGETIIMVGPYGAGKSLTVREVFLRLSAEFARGTVERPPLAIALRDHWGAKYADEILERHAREIGFTPREDLVVAWRAGLALLLIDGFDEVAAQVVAAPANKNFMREARFQALTAARDLLRSTPARSGCLITGRDHYFDNEREMVQALGLAQRPYTMLELCEFPEAQAEEYVRRKGSPLPLPGWLPRKPLILGYLARRSLLKEVLEIDSSRGFGYAWNRFLALICEREAGYGHSVMDPDTLRSLLERLAWDVRATQAGTGPITERELAEAYLSETGQAAGEGVLMQLQRLPGLTPREQDPGSRAFVDSDMLAALQGSAIARFILEARRPGSGRKSRDALMRRAVETASYLLKQAGAEPETVVATGMRSAAEAASLDEQLTADAVAVALAMTEEEDYRLDCLGAVVRNASYRSISLEERGIDGLTLEDCLIGEVVIGPPALDSSILFKRCMILRVAGVSDAAALPASQFQYCEVEEFDALSTNAAIVKSDLPIRTRALLTVLRKVFLQAGGGRKIAALRRGLPPGEMVNSVDDAIHILETHSMASVYNGVVHPVRRHTSRVRAILAAPTLSDDVLLKEIEAG